MSEITSEQYAENKGVNCPVCGADDIEGDDFEVITGRAEQNVWCLHCGAGWTDVYKLIGYDQLER